MWYTSQPTLGPLHVHISADDQMSPAINRPEVMDRRVEVTDASADSVTRSPTQIISPYTPILFNTIKGIQALQKDKVTYSRRTVSVCEAFSSSVFFSCLLGFIWEIVVFTAAECIT